MIARARRLEDAGTFIVEDLVEMSWLPATGLWVWSHVHHRAGNPVRQSRLAPGSSGLQHCRSATALRAIMASRQAAKFGSCLHPPHPSGCLLSRALGNDNRSEEHTSELQSL